MKVSKKLFAHKRVRVCGRKGVGDSSDCSLNPPPPSTPSSGVSPTGLPAVGACMFGGSCSGVGTHSGGFGRSITVSK